MSWLKKMWSWGRAQEQPQTEKPPEQPKPQEITKPTEFEEKAWVQLGLPHAELEKLHAEVSSKGRVPDLSRVMYCTAKIKPKTEQITNPWIGTGKGDKKIEGKMIGYDAKVLELMHLMLERSESAMWIFLNSLAKASDMTRVSDPKIGTAALEGIRGLIDNTNNSEKKLLTQQQKPGQQKGQK